MFWSSICSSIFLATTVLADVQFTSPVAGTTISSNTQVSIAWAEGSGTNPISKLAGYTIFLMVGGDTEATAKPLLTVTGDHTTSTAKTKVLPITSPNVGPPGANAYFLKMVSAGTGGLTVINYSDRFTIPNMAGTWPSPDIQAAYNKVKGDATAVPATQVQGGAAAGVPAAAAPTAGTAFQVPYNQQTGTIKYAPMMNYPATTYLPAAPQVQTFTAAGTHSGSTVENTAAPAATSLNDMEKFLNRWKD